MVCSSVTPLLPLLWIPFYSGVTSNSPPFAPAGSCHSPPVLYGYLQLPWVVAFPANDGDVQGLSHLFWGVTVPFLSVNIIPS